MQSGLVEPEPPHTIDRVPPEVLSRVFELAHASPADWSTTLRSASLVCGRWRDPAQRELFTHVTIDLLTTPAKADAWLASPARGRYRIQSLSVTEGLGSGQEVEEVLKACDGLSSLTLQDDYDESMDRSIWDHHGNRLSHESHLDWGLLRLPSLSNLRSLSLPYPEHLGPPTDPDGTLPLRLSSLSLWLYRSENLEYDISSQFIETLFTASATTLRRLELRLSGDDPANHITHSFHHIAAGITTLSLTIEDEDISFSNLLIECSGLERLDFTTPALPADSPTTFLRRYNELLDGVVLSLPPSDKVKHVYLSGLGAPPAFEHEDEYHSNGVALVVYALLSALAGPALSGLSHLAFPDLRAEDFERVYGGPALSAVMEECASRSVAVTFGDAMV